MSIFKQTIPQLESKLVTLRAEHAKTMDQFALSRAKLETISDRIQDGVDRALFAEGIATAQRDQATARSKLEQLESAIATTKNALTAAVERPVRQKVSKKVITIADELEAAHAQLRTALERMTAAIAAASFRELSSLNGNSGIIDHAFTQANNVAQGGAVAEVVSAYRRHAQLIVEGERSHDLGWNIDEQKSTARKLETEITTDIAARYAKAGAAGTIHYSGTRG